MKYASAIKLVPDGKNADHEEKQRFQQEPAALSAFPLNQRQSRCKQQQQHHHYHHHHHQQQQQCCKRRQRPADSRVRRHQRRRLDNAVPNGNAEVPDKACR